MALSLGVRKGSRILIGAHCLEVKALIHPNLVIVAIDGAEDIVISDQLKTEILPDVTVYSGGGQSGSGNRLAFDAPREISIRRIV